MKFGEIITWPFSKLMVWLYQLTGSYGWAIILFALVVNVILAPLMAESKKSMLRQSRLQPQIQELQRRHEGNPQKLNAEMQKLYREENVNPMSGCLWSLIPFPILIALYSVIRLPLTRMMFVASEFVTTLQEFLIEKGLYAIPAKATAYGEIELTKVLHENWQAVQTGLAGKLDPNLIDLDFSFIGLNLGDQPNPFFFREGVWTWAVIGLFLIPFISAGMSWVSMKLSTALNPTPAGTTDTQAQTQKSMQVMNSVMPIMSVVICFSMPAAMGVYWIANSVFGAARDVILSKIINRQMVAEDAEREARRSEREKEIEARRLETERLRAEGKTEQNANTSKKKLQAGEKQRQEERRAALERAERAERRKRLGIAEAEKPASQVGNRRYARGRAYVPDRFTNPETAAEATAAAALESEGASAIDESVEDDVLTAGDPAVLDAAAVTEAPEEE